MGMSKEYTTLFNGITDAIKELEAMTEKLKQLQQQAEDVVMAKERECEPILFTASNQ